MMLNSFISLQFLIKVLDSGFGQIYIQQCRSKQRYGQIAWTS